MNTKLLSLLSLGLLAAFGSTAATIVWTNTSSGSWNIATNWDPNQVPGPADTVLITNGGIYTVQVDSKTLSVASLILGGGAGTQTLQSYTGGGGPTLTLGNGVIAAHGVLSMYGGSGTTVLQGALQVGGGGILSLDNCRLNNTRAEVQAGGTLTAAGLSSSLYIGSRLAVRTNGTVNLNVNFNSLGPITNTGTINVNAGNLNIQNNGTTTYAGGLVNEAGGTINLNAGSGGLLGGYDKNYLINRGVINAQDPNGSSIRFAKLDNAQGTVQALNSGTVTVADFNSAGNMDGIFYAESGAQFYFNATDDPGTSPGPALQLLGAGAFHFKSGTLYLAADQLPPKLEFNAGTLVPGSSITHDLSVMGGNLGRGSSLAVGSAGRLLIPGYGVSILTPLEVRAGGRIEISGSMTISKTSSLAVNTNAVVEMGGNLYLQGPMTNAGTVNVSGTLSIQNSAGTGYMFLGGVINDTNGVIAFAHGGISGSTSWGGDYLINRGTIIGSMIDTSPWFRISVSSFLNNGLLSMQRGMMQIDPSLVLGPSSILNVVVKGPSDFSTIRYAGSGVLPLAGTFTVTLTNGYVPAAGASFGLMEARGTASTLSGAFASVPPSPPVWRWAPGYTTTQFFVTNLGVCPTIAAAVSGGATICPHDSAAVTVNLAGGTPPYRVTLSHGGGTLTGPSPLTFAVTPAAATTYSVLSAVDANDCTAAASGSATILLDPPSLPLFYAFTNFVGQPGVAGSTDGTGSAANFRLPYGVAVDAAGNVFVSDQYNYTIRKVTPAGEVSTLAGSAGNWGGADGTGSAARFKAPAGLATDAAGNVYVADQQNNTIRKVTPAGQVSTLAGSAEQVGTADGLGSGARFNSPVGLAVDAAGNVLVADTYNHTIRKITPAGQVSTLAGSAGNPGSADGAGSSAQFYYPSSVGVDSAGNVIAVDSFNHTIRKITPDGVVTTVAGSAGLRGTQDGSGSAARFNFPSSLTIDSADDLFVTDGSSTIRKVTAAGDVTTVAGSPGDYGANDGPGPQAQFYMAYGLAIDNSRRLYVADSFNQRVTKGTPCYAPAITTSSPLPPGRVGTPYSQPLAACAGAASYTWTIASGALPAGLGLTNGTITGTPTVVGTAHFALQLTDSIGLSTLANFSLIINPVELTIATTSPLPAGMVGRAYSQFFSVGGGVLPYAWTVTSGGLPAGLALSGGGVLSGTPMGAGTTNVTVTVTDAIGISSSGNFSLTINPSNGCPVTISGDRSGLSGTTVQMAYDGNVTSYFRSSYTDWQYVQIDLGCVGMFSGLRRYMSVAGNTNSNRGGQGEAVNYSADGVTWTYVYATNSHGWEGYTNYGAAQLAWSSVSYGWSAWLNPTVPVAARYIRFNWDGNNDYLHEIGLQIQPLAPLTITTPNLPAGIVGTAYSQPLAAGGGVPSYTWALVNGSLPAGLGLTNGAICGTPTATETATFIVRVTDSAGSASGQEFSLTIAPGPIMVTTTNPLPAGVVSLSYNQPLEADGGVPPYAWALVAGSLPAGLDLSSGGVISGKPLAPAIASFTAQVTDSLGASVASVFSLTINGAAADVYAFTNLAGLPTVSGTNNGSGQAARFNTPVGTAVDEAGNVYVADYHNHIIRKITPAGVVTTLAGSAGLGGTNDGTGAAARFNLPSGVAVDHSGTVYVTDRSNHTIRAISPAGVVSTLAGKAGVSGTNNGTGSAARFYVPYGLAVDNAGNLYVGDHGSYTIRKVTPTGVVTTLAGYPLLGGTNDGTGSAARFGQMCGVAVDSAGNVFVGDTSNHTVRKVTPGGVVTTLAGAAGVIGSSDGPGGDARFNSPSGVAVDSDGDVLVADSWNHAIRRVTSAGVVTTVGSIAGHIGIADGVGSEARFNQPIGLAIDSAANLYVGDARNYRVTKGTPAHLLNRPPVLEAIADTDVNELNPLSLQLVASDPDAGDTRTFALLAGPANAAVNPGSGLFTWTPTEAQGPGTYPVQVVVTDNGTPPLSDARAFTITVHEVNRAPALNAIGSQTIAELATLRLTAVASDPDMPTNRLRFSLPVAPAGATIDPDTGVFTWTAPDLLVTNSSTNFLAQIVVEDDGTPSLSATQSFNLRVFSPDLVNVHKWLPEAIADCQADWPMYANSSGSSLYTADGISNAWFKAYHSGRRLCLLAGDLPVDSPTGAPDHFALLIRTDLYAGPTVTPVEYRFQVGRDGAWSAQRGTTGGSFTPINVPAEDLTVATVTNGDRWTLELLLSLEWFGGYGRYERFSLILETADGEPVVQWPNTAQAANPSTWGRWILLPRYPTATEAMGVQVAGQDGYLVVPNAAALNPPEVTMEAWVQLLDSTNHGTFLGNGADQSTWFGLGGPMALSVNGGVLAGSGNTSIAPGGWHHVAAAVSSNGLCTLYLDGQPDAQWAATPPFALAGSDRHLHIGWDLDTAEGSENLRCWIRDLRIWNCARTAAQIQDSASGTPLSVEPGLVGWWPFTNTLRDVVGGNDAGRIGDACLVRTGRPTLTITAGPPGPPARIDWLEEFPLQGWRIESITDLSLTNWTEFTSAATNGAWLTPAGYHRVFLVPDEPARFFRAVKP